MVTQILKNMEITGYEARVINQMLEFASRFVTTLLNDTRIFSSRAMKATVGAGHVQLAIQCCADQLCTSPPPRDF